MEPGFPVGVVEAGLSNKNSLGIKNRGLENITEGDIIFRIGLDRELMNGELKISRGKPEGEPGVVANREGLIEFLG